MPILLALFALVAFPLLIVIAVLFGVLVGAWKLLVLLSELPAWLLAMTVVLSLFAGVCFVMAVTSW